MDLFPYEDKYELFDKFKEFKALVENSDRE
jgi:hypothetical protein